MWRFFFEIEGSFQFWNIPGKMQKEDPALQVLDKANHVPLPALPRALARLAFGLLSLGLFLC